MKTKALNYVSEQVDRLGTETAKINEKLTRIDSQIEALMKKVGGNGNGGNGKPKPEVQMKHCTHCGELKPATVEYFSARSDSRDGLQSWCKECVKKYKSHFEQQAAPMKRCARCGELKPATSEFFSKGNCKDGLHSYCKACAKKISKEYNAKQREKKQRARLIAERDDVAAKLKAMRASLRALDSEIAQGG